MSATHEWNDLPADVRDAVQTHIGPVAHATAVKRGQSNDIAARLDREGRPPVFLKGVRGGGRRAMFLTNEAASADRAPGIAPAVVCHVDLDDWLLVGFEYITGRHPSLAPGSPDLDTVAATVEAISHLPAQGVRPLRLRWKTADSWQIVGERKPDLIDGWDVDEMSRWSARVPDLVDGDRLLHTDLHYEQLLITEHGHVHVVDWAFPAAGARWVDTAFLVLRLIWAGHTPTQAEQWARARSTWTGLDEDTITAFAVYVAGLWTEFLVARPPTAGADRRATLARDYAAWRLKAL